MSEREEIAVIGSCLVETRALRIASEIVAPEHFTSPQLGATFAIMRRLLADGIEVDQVTLHGHMTAKEQLDAGGIETLQKAIDLVPSALHVEHYAHLVRRDFFRRRLTELLEKNKTEDDAKLRKQIRDCWDEIDGIGSVVIDLDDGLFQWEDDFTSREARAQRTLKTGFPNFDRVTGGVSPGDLVIVGARTSRGKTSALLTLAATYFLTSGKRVLFVTAEMTAMQIMDRLVAITSGVSLSNIRNGTDNPEITAALETLHKKPFFIADVPRLTMGKLLEAIQNTKPDIVMVDYLQRFAVPEKTQNRAAYFSDVANNLKYLAKLRNVSIFASSQLGRAMEFGEKREPTLADLKESGGLEEAADIVVLIHSPEDGILGVRQIDLIVAKNRNGMLGKIPFEFVEFTTAFRECEYGRETRESTHEETTRIRDSKRGDPFS